MLTTSLREPVRVATRWWKRHMHVRTLVLCYHRVTRVDRDPQLLAVSPERFDEQMQMLRELGDPIAMSGWGQNSEKKRQIAVTFDDGYTDNLTEAKPILERHNIAATVYVASGFVDRTREFYWDALESLFFDQVKTPTTVRLMVNRKWRQWDVDPGMTVSRDWCVLDECAKDSPASAYREWCEMLRPMLPDQRDQAIGELAQQLHCDVPTRSTHRVMTCDQLREIDSDLVCVGAHTADHVELGIHSLDKQRHQILTSKQILEQILNRRVNGFSYPYGSRSAFDDRSMAIVREAGFSHAMANFPGVGDSTTDRYQIPRMLVRDWDGDRFARYLREWFDA